MRMVPAMKDAGVVSVSSRWSKKGTVARYFGHRGRGQRDERGPGTQPRKIGRGREVAGVVGQAGRQ